MRKQGSVRIRHSGVAEDVVNWSVVALVALIGACVAANVAFELGWIC
jgi:hypothetical protein